MTQTQINKAAKKADAALVKVQDLFYGLDINSEVATLANEACDKLRDLISEIESTEPKRKSN